MSGVLSSEVRGGAWAAARAADVQGVRDDHRAVLVVRAGTEAVEKLMGCGAPHLLEWLDDGRQSDER
jgi:hypothetical protein